MSTTVESGNGHPSTGPALRSLIRRVHYLAGLAIGPFLAVLCLTGLAYAFTPTINEFVYRDLWTVDVGGSAPRPVSEQVEAALAAVPDAELAGVDAGEPGRSTAVVLQIPDLAADEERVVYVDPYDNDVLGELTTVGGRPPAQAWLRELHGNLLLGTVGRLYAEFAASWLPVVVIGGLVLWIGDRRRRGVRALFAPALRAGPMSARLRMIHGALGLWLSVGLLAVSITGLTWSNYAGSRVDAVIDALDARAPALRDEPVELPPVAVRISVDHVLTVAESAGIERPLALTVPSGLDGRFEVAESGEGLPIRRDAVAINPYTAEITDRVGWADYPLPAKLTTLGIQAHSGTLLGLVNEIVMALLAIGALVLLALGYRMWWRRRGSANVSADVRGPSLVQLEPRVGVGVVLATVVVAWAMPVLGVTLVGFLLLDVAVSRSRRTSPVSQHR
jgi:uncharacterized iron-regulated membrane protein